MDQATPPGDMGWAWLHPVAVVFPRPGGGRFVPGATAMGLGGDAPPSTPRATDLSLESR